MRPDSSSSPRASRSPGRGRPLLAPQPRPPGSPSSVASERQQHSASGPEHRDPHSTRWLGTWPGTRGLLSPEFPGLVACVCWTALPSPQLPGPHQLHPWGRERRGDRVPRASSIMILWARGSYSRSGLRHSPGSQNLACLPSTLALAAPRCKAGSPSQGGQQGGP